MLMDPALKEWADKNKFNPVAVAQSTKYRPSLLTFIQSNIRTAYPKANFHPDIEIIIWFESTLIANPASMSKNTSYCRELFEIFPSINEWYGIPNSFSELKAQIPNKNPIWKLYEAASKAKNRRIMNMLEKNPTLKPSLLGFNDVFIPFSNLVEIFKRAALSSIISTVWSNQNFRNLYLGKQGNISDTQDTPIIQALPKRIILQEYYRLRAIKTVKLEIYQDIAQEIYNKVPEIENWIKKNPEPGIIPTEEDLCKKPVNSPGCILQRQELTIDSLIEKFTALMQKKPIDTNKVVTLWLNNPVLAKWLGGEKINCFGIIDNQIQPKLRSEYFEAALSDPWGCVSILENLLAGSLSLQQTIQSLPFRTRNCPNLYEYFTLMVQSQSLRLTRLMWVEKLQHGIKQLPFMDAVESLENLLKNFEAIKEGKKEFIREYLNNMDNVAILKVVLKKLSEGTSKKMTDKEILSNQNQCILIGDRIRELTLTVPPIILRKRKAVEPANEESKRQRVENIDNKTDNIFLASVVTDSSSFNNQKIDPASTEEIYMLPEEIVENNDNTGRAVFGFFDPESEVEHGPHNPWNMFYFS